VQERAIKLMLSDGDTDEASLAGLVAELSVADGTLSRPALVDFAIRFQAKGLWANAVQALIGAPSYKIRLGMSRLCGSVPCMCSPADACSAHTAARHAVTRQFQL
jgi:hypothetical protein